MRYQFFFFEVSQAMAEVKDQDIIRDIVSEMIERRQKRLNRSGYNDNLKRRQFQKSQNSPASGNSLLSLHENFNNKVAKSFFQEFV